MNSEYQTPDPDPRFCIWKITSLINFLKIYFYEKTSTFPVQIATVDCCGFC